MRTLDIVNNVGNLQEGRSNEGNSKIVMWGSSCTSSIAFVFSQIQKGKSKPELLISYDVGLRGFGP